MPQPWKTKEAKAHEIIKRRNDKIESSGPGMFEVLRIGYLKRLGRATEGELDSS